MFDALERLRRLDEDYSYEKKTPATTKAVAA